MPGPGSIAVPKPTRTARLKAKRAIARGSADYVAQVRAYVFARERNVCRCCRLRRAESMHEIRPRSLRGRVGKTNSIAVCGSGTTQCHGYLQAHRIAVETGTMGAEGGICFVPTDAVTREWLRLPSAQHGLESLPMRTYEDAV